MSGRREPPDGFGGDDWNENMPIPVDRDELASLRARAAEVDAMQAERDKWRNRATQIRELADLREAAHATLRAHVEALTAALRINGMRQGATHAQIDDWMVMINIAALKGAKP